MKVCQCRHPFPFRFCQGALIWPLEMQTGKRAANLNICLLQHAPLHTHTRRPHCAAFENKTRVGETLAKRSSAMDNGNWQLLEHFESGTRKWQNCRGHALFLCRAVPSAPLTPLGTDSRCDSTAGRESVGHFFILINWQRHFSKTWQLPAHTHTCVRKGVCVCVEYIIKSK